ncbi:hypothetical protein PV371_25620 [Streptomyces sp. TX20-6-3]|uniref:hypothetical protein n=1 Tax=Streptomyces sp. TX20-6-3 TaxID=3028705 RepID=UPI0029A770C8|nr:hypothetical protein [Streptomyces sp. TX20-6-3]MDX2563015.1 hypothetical protein [Streptomyces sp. TX20-6-3]
MSRTWRSTLGVAGAFLWVLVSAFAAGPAQAAAADGPRGGGGHTMVMPPAPRGEGPTTRAVAAVSPTVSPWADYVHTTSGSPVTCASGNLCTGVWDPVVGKYKVFFLYRCQQYSLSHWNGVGQVVNNQVGAAAFFYGQNGQVLDVVLPEPTPFTYDWTPVWSIRNC